MFFSRYTVSADNRLAGEGLAYKAALVRYEEAKAQHQQSQNEKNRIINHLDIAEMQNIFSNNKLLFRDQLIIFIKGLAHGVSYSSDILKWLGLNHKDELFRLFSNVKAIGLSQAEILNMLKNSLSKTEDKQPDSPLGIIWNVQRGLFSCCSRSGTLKKVKNYVEAGGFSS